MRMHAAGNFSPCSIEGQLSLKPTIMDKFLWDTHSSIHFWDFTESLRRFPLPPHPINVGHKLVHFQSCTLISLHFPQATLFGGGRGLQKSPEYAISELKDKMLNCSEQFVHDCSLMA